MSFQRSISHLQIHKNNMLYNASLKVDTPNNQAGLVSHAGEIEWAIGFLKVASLGGVSALISLVRQWGQDRNITGPNAKATVDSQFKKLLEEVDEIREGIEKKDKHEIIDGIGDATVVLILLAELAGVRFETCLLVAYEEIKNRKGSMINGIFYKEA